MTHDTWLVGCGALAVSAVATLVARRIALSTGVLDVPNSRSSHSIPTPRGGGIAIVVAATLAFSILIVSGAISIGLFVSLAGGGLIVAGVGLVDDRRPVRPAIRLAVHFCAAIWGVAWLGRVDIAGLSGTLPGWAVNVLAVLGIVWSLNLLNFMDGIDGLAASEACFVAIAGALLPAGGVTDGVPSAAAVFALACGGFLLWNWPPAKIFMGDVGSGYLGFVIAILAIGAARTDPAALWIWLILSGAFVVDATVTLVRRVIRGERIYEAHRSHAYQWLARRWRSHTKATLAYTVVNVTWLLPCAWVAAQHPSHAISIAAVALAPVVGFGLAAGAGRRERPEAFAAGRHVD